MDIKDTTLPAVQEEATIIAIIFSLLRSRLFFFKTGGNGDYIKSGDEAKKFFNSIQLKEFKNGGWKKFQPAYGGFSIDFPQQPYESFGNNVQYDAEDKASGEHFFSYKDRYS